MSIRRTHRLGLEEVRPLGARVAFFKHEWLPNIFRRVGYAFEASADDMTNWCGLNDLSHQHLKRLPVRLNEKAVTGIHIAFGFSRQQLQTTVMDDLPTDFVEYRPNGTPVQSKDWSRGSGTRFCVECLRIRPGVFYTYWRTWWSFICVVHRTVLRSGCSSCSQDVVEASLRESQVRNPELCWAFLPNGDHCMQRLADTWDEPPLEEESPAFKVQLLFSNLWMGLPVRFPYESARNLRGIGIALHGAGDIDRIAKLSQIPAVELNGLLDARGSNGGVPPKEPLAMAALMGAAMSLLTCSESERREHIRATNFLRPVRSKEPVEGPGSARYLLSFWPGISGGVRQRVLHALDQDLPTTQRLIHGSASSFETYEIFQVNEPNTVPEFEMNVEELHNTISQSNIKKLFSWDYSMVPKLMWPSWATPLGVNNKTDHIALQIALADALRIAGTAHDSNAEAVARIGKKLRPSMLGTPDQTTSVLRQLTDLALLLRSAPGPIDYERRLGIPTDQLLRDDHWLMVAESVGEHPGAERRIVNARRYLFLRMSATAPTDLPATMQFRTGTEDVADYTKFVLSMSSELKTALDDYLFHWLTRFEGLSKASHPWSSNSRVVVTYAPPRFVHQGAHLAPELEDIDLPLLHEMVGSGVTSLGMLAEAVNRSPRHVRWALAEHPLLRGNLVQPIDWSAEMRALKDKARSRSRFSS